LSKHLAATLWRHRDFTKLWAGQTISQFGSQITPLALPLTAALILHATPAEMGILSAVETAPFLLVGLFAGVWVDRLRRRPILLAALTISLLYAVAFLVGILTVFFDVAYQSFLPALVGRGQLLEGNSKLELAGRRRRSPGRGLRAGWCNSSPRRWLSSSMQRPFSSPPFSSPSSASRKPRPYPARNGKP